MKNDKKIQLLKDVKEVLDRNNITFFPTGGTLLGFIREQRIMPWDADMDFGIWHTDYDKLFNIRKEFEELGYKTFFAKGKYQHCSICHPEGYAHYTDPEKYDVPFHAGFSFWAEDRDKAIQLRFFDNNLFDRLFGEARKKIKCKTSIKIYNFFRRSYCAFVLYFHKIYVYPLPWFEKLDTIQIYDMDIKIISNSGKYLEMMYGDNWRTPDKVWTKKKHLDNTRFLIRYKIKEKDVKDMWIKRWEKSFSKNGDTS